MGKQPPAKTIITGAGYTGGRLARALRDENPMALVRSADSVYTLTTDGIDAHELNIDSAASLPARADPHATVYYLVPPPRDTHGDPRLSRFLDMLGSIGRLVYVSTTGVYGDCQGQTVDEDRAPAPVSARARRRLDAESQVRRWCTRHHVAWVILRVPGIYGPGRLQLGSLDSGQPVIAPDEASPGNRIHADDLVGALRAAAALDEANRIFNVGDGDHATQFQFLKTLARLTGRQPPPTVSMATARRTFSAMRLSFVGESRRIDNRRMVHKLGVDLRYPDHESGIRASLAETSSD